jgi:hypothetical protein
MAITQSPTRISSLAPGNEGQRLVGLDLEKGEVGVRVGADDRRLEFSPEKNSIWISSAPWITWLFVTM